MIDLEIKSRSQKSNPGSTQYSIPDLLSTFKNSKPADCFAYILLTGPNLFSQNQNATSILGQTYFVDSMAFCSIGQYLHGEPPSDYSAYLYSTLRVTSHEIGHCYGLVHCPDTSCGMQASKSGIDAVKEKINFCNCGLRNRKFPEPKI